MHNGASVTLWLKLILAKRKAQHFCIRMVAEPSADGLHAVRLIPLSFRPQQWLQPQTLQLVWL